MLPNALMMHVGMQIHTHTHKYTCTRTHHKLIHVTDVDNGLHNLVAFRLSWFNIMMIEKMVLSKR